MPKINLLPQEIAELIAAGEVVERPASVIKELIENSIDAGAKHITVEIQRGGILYMRVTDDGCGISPDDVPIAFLRHATSKISKSDDLDGISTLGFRGEALAATAAVSRIEMLTKVKSCDFGTRYIIEGGRECINEECGCADGTTIIIRDIFFNTPARMKFLKKDVSEGNAVAAVVERAALSHPEIAIKLVREGKNVLSTSGDGELLSAIYSVLGRDFSKGLIEVSAENYPIKVQGYTCKPVNCKQSRAGQYVFLNGRLVRSGTVTAAVEQAYKNSSMVGKFPCFVLNVSLPFDMVDVNVHPAKTEVRFSDERKIFEAVHYAVKNAIILGDTRPVIPVTPAKKQAETFIRMNSEEFRKQTSGKQQTIAEEAYLGVKQNPPTRFHDDGIPFFTRSDVKEYISKKKDVSIEVDKPIETDVSVESEPVSPKNEAKPLQSSDFSLTSDPQPQGVENFEDDLTKSTETEEIEVKYVGEAFATYIVVQREQSIFLIDKHAAHERIIFNDMKSQRTVSTQALLTPITVRLGYDEYTAALENITLLEKAGFEVEDFGNNTLIIRAVPASLKDEDASSIITEACHNLSVKGSVEIERLDDLYHSVACKAAIKAGNITQPEELLNLAKRVLSDNEVMYCPHGRPIAFEIKRRDLEKHFGRIQ